MEERASNQNELKRMGAETSKSLEIAEENVAQVLKSVKAMQEEMSVVEKDAFKDFCKKLSFKNVQEYEAQLNGSGSDIFDKKNELERLITKLETEI